MDFEGKERTAVISDESQVETKETSLDLPKDTPRDMLEEFRRMKTWLITDGRFDIRVVEGLKLVLE